jgi:hypothetical protein
MDKSDIFRELEDACMKAERLLECYENPDLEENVEREIVTYIDNRKSEFFKS